MFALISDVHGNCVALDAVLDELIRSLDHARTQLVRLEQMSDEELEQIEEEFEELREAQGD